MGGVDGFLGGEAGGGVGEVLLDEIDGGGGVRTADLLQDAEAVVVDPDVAGGGSGAAVDGVEPREGTPHGLRFRS